MTQEMNQVFNTKNPIVDGFKFQLIVDGKKKTFCVPKAKHLTPRLNRLFLETFNRVKDFADDENRQAEAGQALLDCQTKIFAHYTGLSVEDFEDLFTTIDQMMALFQAYGQYSNPSDETDENNQVDGGVEGEVGLGGILSLASLIGRYGEAIEADLITHGLRLRDLGSERFSWRDLWVLIQTAPPSSRISVAMHGDGARWTYETHLLAGILDRLEGANWQRGGGKGAKPKPIPRPNTGPAKKLKARRGMPLSEYQAKYETTN